MERQRRRETVGAERGGIWNGCFRCGKPYTPNPDHVHYCDDCVQVCQSCLTLHSVTAFNYKPNSEERMAVCHVCEMRLIAEGKLPERRSSRTPTGRATHERQPSPTVTKAELSEWLD